MNSAAVQQDNEHVPVLLDEVVSGLNIPNDGIYVDLTIGRAGHASKILKAIPHGMLYGFDQDQEAIKEATRILAKHRDNYSLIEMNFVQAADYLQSIGITEVDGVLLDLGVSSPQFDQAERGFSYRKDGPLDMRMDQIHNPLTAAQIVNTYSLEELTKIFREYGEERFAYQISKNIVRQRYHAPINTTFELVEIIKASKPAKELRKPGHPAKRVFQALRIAVNDELNVLKTTLADMLGILKSGGRLAVITFHSLEDRIVKNVFKSVAVVEGNRRLPYQEEAQYRLVNRQVIVPSSEEVLLNHRAHSAKLRIIERK